MRRLTKEKFIAKAKAIHGNKYDYSKIEYKGSKDKICIICPEHGEFWQSPSNHYHYGCVICGGTYKIDTNEFIKRAKKVHGDKYSYTKVNYKTNEIKVTITCPIHGDFEQTPHDHLNGHGCPICGGALHYTQEDFIQRAKEIHGEQYSYDKVKYTKSTNKVIITCPKHGDFLQVPAAHLSGVGCPKCKRSRGEEIISMVLDALNIKYEEQYRIKGSFRTRKEIVVDFYLPNNNCIIEFNGAQHYIPMEFFGGEKQLRDQQQRDEELRQYCNQNNIKLLEIPYYEKQIKETIISKLS